MSWMNFGSSFAPIYEPPGVDEVDETAELDELDGAEDVEGLDSADEVDAPDSPLSVLKSAMFSGEVANLADLAKHTSGQDTVTFQGKSKK